jgi:hypothetical protein
VYEQTSHVSRRHALRLIPVSLPHSQPADPRIQSRTTTNRTISDHNQPGMLLMTMTSGASLCHSFTPEPLKRSNPGAS